MKAWNSTLPARREKPRRSPRTPEKGEGASILHPGPFRSQTLRDLAQECPHCMDCGRTQDGTIVACHPNSLAYDKGMGQKAHDVPAFFCSECHSILDGRAGTLTRFEKEVMFLRGAYASMVWLLQNHFIEVMHDPAA